MAVIDVYSRELLTLRAYDGWDVDSAWTMRILAAAMSKLKRRPTAVMHDRAPQFAAQVERQLRVLEVDQCRLPPRLPALKGVLERTSNRYAGSCSTTFAWPLSSSSSGTWMSIARITTPSAVTKASMARPPRTVPTVLPLLTCSI